MATPDKAGRPLPKFGEWDVKNLATAAGFTVIFQKARDDKKTTGPGNVQAGIPPAFRNNAGDGHGDGGYSRLQQRQQPAHAAQAHQEEVGLLWVLISKLAAVDQNRGP